jgi:hypothetical protein
MARKKKDDYPDLKTLHAWTMESHMAFMDWRAESWRDCEMFDGGDAQWTQEDWDAATAAGIDPMTINRTFPTTNVILGTQVLNQFNLMAKGRTQKDSETGQVMSEAIQFIMDQWEGEFLISQAFKDQVIPGWGCLGTPLNHDPRKEKIKVAYRDWKEMWWDPFGSPWFEPERTRYVFYQRWMDLDDLTAMFWEKKRDIEEQYEEFSSTTKHDYGATYMDESTLIEEERRVLTGGEWADSKRRRVRPVQMWYVKHEPGWFASFADGRVIELSDDLPPPEVYDIVSQSTEVVQSVVPRMNVCTFFGEIELHRNRTPFPHDQYPFIPFIGYLDRYLYPYGVPRQIRGQNIEINKRRSMALALLRKRRVLAESDVVEGEEGLKELYTEANKIDGFLVVDPGKKDAIEIVESTDLSNAHMGLMQQSENEIQEVSGANAEMSGYQSNAKSGVAIEKRQQQGAVMTAPLMENLRRSSKMLGFQLGSNIQGFWQGPKVLRVTDRLTGADRFVALNEVIPGEGGKITVKNNITQGKYDYIITQSPATDTVREQYLNLLMETIKKSPPEVVPQLLSMSFELMDLPNKEALLARLKPLLGVSPEDEDLSPEEIKQKAIQELEAQKQAAGEAAELEKRGVEQELEKAAVETQLERAKIREIDETLKMEKAKLVQEHREKMTELEIKREEVKAKKEAAKKRPAAA